MQGLVDYTPQKSSIVTAHGDTLDIEAYGSLRIQPLSPGSPGSVKLKNVCYGPKLAYDLFSLRAATALGYSFEGTSEEIALHLQNRGTVRFPTCGKLSCLEAMRVPPRSDFACATLVPGKGTPTRSCSISSFHMVYGHLNEALLRKTAASMRTTLTGKLEPCSECSQATASKRAIPSCATVRATERLGRIYADLSGPKPVPSLGDSCAPVNESISVEIDDES